MLWLQTDELYADIRIARPFAAGSSAPTSSLFRTRAFAGTARWEEPCMVWEHLLDSDLSPGSDVGTIDLGTPGWAYEDGTFVWQGEEISFREEWELLSSPEDVGRAVVTRSRISVTVGRWRIDLSDDRPAGPFCAVKMERASDRWEVIGMVST